MKRYISASLPHWPTDRRRSPPSEADRPLALTTPGAGGPRITAVNPAAAAEGLYPGQRLADARALVPQLRAADADPAGDAEALGRLADWCLRYTPWAAPDGEDGLVLDVTGCAHLWGGEDGLIADLERRLRSFGLVVRAACADTPAAAWAWARFGDGAILPPGEARARMPGLPVDALRLSIDTIEPLRRLGLRRIGDLVGMPRGPLAARFGDGLLQRLDAVFGAAGPISPRRPAPAWRVRLSFADGIARREDIDAALRELLDELGRALESDGRGARQLELGFYRLDGTTQFLAAGTSRPSRDTKHLAHLFAEKLGTVDPGFGVETMILAALATDRMSERQVDLVATTRGHDDLAALVDRLQNRLGTSAATRAVPVASHIPERAVARRHAMAPVSHDTWPTGRPRPVRLLPRPEPIDAVGVPGEPPRRFRWRRLEHHVSEAQGPERLSPEWWRAPAHEIRDYYWLQDAQGRRFWVYRLASQTTPAWYLHGMFA